MSENRPATDAVPAWRDKAHERKSIMDAQDKDLPKNLRGAKYTIPTIQVSIKNGTALNELQKEYVFECNKWAAENNGVPIPEFAAYEFFVRQTNLERNESDAAALKKINHALQHSTEETHEQAIAMLRLLKEKALLPPEPIKK